MTKIGFQTPTMVECSGCGCWFKEYLKKCPRCFQVSENFIVDSWRNYKTKLKGGRNQQSSDNQTE